MAPNTNDLALAGFGLHSSLGGLASAAAAFRCGLTRARELPDWPYFDEDTLHERKLVGHPAAGIEDGFQGMGRLLKMAEYALADLCQVVPPSDLNSDRLGVLFVLPTSDDEQPLSIRLRNDFPSFVEKLWKRSGLGPLPRDTRAIFEGRIGTVTALCEAKQLLATGKLDACLIGAIDTLLDPVRLGALASEELVKTVDQPTGLMPGEAACFALVQRAGGQQASATVLADPARAHLGPRQQPAPPPTVPPEPPAEAKEPAPPTGEVLSKAILQALQQARTEPTPRGTLFTDLNGEEARAADLGSALVRTRPHYDLGAWDVAIPALSFGDTGAAGTLLAVGLATRAFARGYAAGDTCLVLTSSSTEESGAFVLRRPSHG